jgi:hypothetical protein
MVPIALRATIIFALSSLAFAAPPTSAPSTQPALSGTTLDDVQAHYDLSLRTARTQYLHDLHELLRRAMKAENLDQANAINDRIHRAEKETPQNTSAAALDPQGLQVAAVEAGGHRFIVILTPMSWDDAQKTCMKMGGHLAYAKTKERIAYFSSLCGVKWAWVGAQKSKGEWHWLDGTPVERSLWPVNQPDNRGGNETVGIINDLGLCDLPTEWPEVKGFICKWDQ